MKAVLIPLLLLLVGRAHADEYAELFRKAALHSQEGKYEEAFADYKAALTIHPGAPETLNNLAVTAYELHRYPEALRFASLIWKSHPELKAAALIAGMAAVQCNRAKDAIAPLQSLLATDTANRDALLALASAFFAQGRFDDAIATYDRQIAISSVDAMAWYGRAICYERMAEGSSNKLAVMPGGRAFSKLMLAQYLQGVGDNKLAAEAFGESEVIGENASAKQEYERARTLALHSQESFERFVSLAPDSWQAAVFLGDVARQHGDLVSARDHYKDALQKQEDCPGAILGLGTVYWEMGEFDQAESYLQRTLQKNPRATQAVFELANIAVRQHQESQAIPLLKQYLLAQPDALAARADLGRAYLHLGQYANAARELRKAAATDERGEIHYQLSLALRKLGRDQEAQQAAQESAGLREAQLAREQQRHAAQ